MATATGNSFTCLGIHYLQLVTGIVDVHLVAGIMLHMANGSRRERVTLKILAESRALVAVGMSLPVLVIERFHGYNIQKIPVRTNTDRVNYILAKWVSTNMVSRVS